MQIKLAVPEINYIMDYMLGNRFNIDETDIKLIFGSEQSSLEALINNDADAAIITPREYGKALKLLDLRIMHQPFVTASGYSGLATIEFQGKGDKIESCYCPSPDSYLMNIGRLVLSEKYGLAVKFVENENYTKDSPEMLDISMIWGTSETNPRTLDITEEWMDAFDIPLPLAFWVCRSDNFPEHIQEVVKSLIGNFIQRIGIKEPNSSVVKNLPRTGELLTTYTPEIESALDQTFHVLFYHQVFDEIPSIKMFGL
jgi:hypothetical protein